MAATHSGETAQQVEPFGGSIGRLFKFLASIPAWAFVRISSGTRVALQLLDPRVHLLSLRIRSVADGRLVKNSDKLALLVVYCGGSLPAFTRTLIEALNRSQFDLIVVSNGTLDFAARSYLLDRSRLLIERVNVGRDFGGYKDGIAIIQRRYPDVEKLLLANDSVFYLPQGLDELLDHLAREGDVIAVSEVFEHHYHVASFLVSFGKAVLDSAGFHKFWRRYRPISTRRWGILRGEGRLTKTLIASGFKPRVLYETEGLRRCLKGCSVPQLLLETTSLPRRARDALFQKWNGVAANGSTPDAAARLAGDIASTINLRNQMHYGGFLFRRHLGMPVVKRDLVYRGIFSLQDTLTHLKDVEASLLDSVAADLRARANPDSYGPLRRMLYRHGAI